MRLPVSSPVILSELEGAKAILDKWIAQVARGIPGVDLPAPEDHLNDFLRELCGELVVTATKCQGLAEILAAE